MKNVNAVKNTILAKGFIVPIKEDENTYCYVNSKTREIICYESGAPVRTKSQSSYLAEMLAISKATELNSINFPDITVSDYKTILELYINPDALVA